MTADLKLIHAEPLGNDIVATLEFALAMARRGELSSVAIAWVLRDGCCGRTWSQSPSLVSLIGSVARLGHKLNDLMDG